MDQEKVCKQHTNNDSLGVQQGRPEATPDHQKAPLIRAVGRVIYFDGVKREGAKLREAFPHSPAEISSRAGPPPWRERGILRA